ncbi:MAG: hypothetical protein JXA57_04995 [Armatimonadetes bacterium]|nr:hypothetical protein [Armatimonadota bacterium]
MASAVSETIWSIARLADTSDGVSISEAREIDRSDYERLALAATNLNRAVSLDVFEIVSRNMETIDSIHETLVRRGQDDDPGLKRSKHYVSTSQFGGSVLSALSNYLSSGRMYTDSVKDILSTSYGKSSASYAGFTQDLESLFDRSAGYRFTYHLRNALQHVGSLPLSITESDSASLEDTVGIVSNRDRLLAAYDWHARVRSDLLSGPEVVGLLPLLREGYAGYVWLERRRVRRCLEELRHQVLELNEIVHNLREEGRQLLLLALHRPANSTPERQMTFEVMVLPSLLTLEAVARGYETGDFDQVLPRGYERPVPGSRRAAANGALLGPALDLLDTQYTGGQTAAAQEIARTIDRGPQATTNLISSLVSLNMITLSQVEMAIGQSVESQICSWRPGGGDDGLSMGDE